MRRVPAVIAAALMLAGCGRDDPAQQEQAEQPGDERVLTGTEPGVTPMAERVAVIGLLNKRNGIVRNLRMRPGQAVRAKDAIVRLRACETTAPWESEKLTGAFIQLDVQGSDDQWRRVFSGWLYSEAPSLNVVEHPVYDVWPKSCAMSFPDGSAESSAPAAASNRSSAQRSPQAKAPPAAEPSPAPEPETEPSPPSAAVSNST